MQYIYKANVYFSGFCDEEDSEADEENRNDRELHLDARNLNNDSSDIESGNEIDINSEQGNTTLSC